ncbi:MAG: DUF1819 family protein [Anaerolineaceae bacterium]|nr:DUF1819 family protein [Anaerolineaceae bacterium]
MIEETRKLFEVWSPGMDTSDLQAISLEQGLFPQVTSRRLKNIIHEGFGARYLVSDDYPAKYLKVLAIELNSKVFNQLLLIYTCRSNIILSDFIKDVFWQSFEAGKNIITQEQSERFVLNSMDQGKTNVRWADSTIRRVSSYLTGACVDFGLMKKDTRNEFILLPYRIEEKSAVYLSYDLHFSGKGDNAVLGHQDWELFGLKREDVLDEFKRLALKDWFIVQSAGLASRIGWKYDTMMEVVHALAE